MLAAHAERATMWRALLVYLVFSALSFCLTACGGGGASGDNNNSGGDVTTPTVITLQSIDVSPTNFGLSAGNSQQYTATGTYSDNSTRDLTALVVWSSDTSSVAAVGAGSGMVSAVSEGRASIIAAHEGKSATATVTVSATAVRTLSSIALDAGALSLATGASQQLVATGTYSDNSTSTITSTVAWTTSDAVIASVSSTGLVITGATTGSAVVTATLGALTASSRISVTTPARALASIRIPVAPFLYVGQPTDQTHWVDGFFSDGTGVTPYTNVNWTLANCLPSNTASVDAQGAVVAKAVGTCQIIARASPTISATSTLTVVEPPLVSIDVSPVSFTVAAGSTIQLTALGTYAGGLQRDITSTANWSSLNPSVASVGSAGSGTPGLVTGVAAGTAGIRTVVPTTPTPVLQVTGSATATVQASEPVAVTLSLPVVADNTIGISSINSSIQRTVFPVKGFTDDPGIAVGCIWSLLLDPFSGSNYQNFICAGGLVKFDLSAIAGRTVVSATLKLQTSLFGVGIVPRTWHLHALASPWSPAAVNWDNAPQQYFITSQRANLVPPNFTGQIYNIDVTTTVRNWASGQWANNGFALGLDDVSFPYVISVDPFEFYSNESAGGRGPQLIVTAL